MDLGNAHSISTLPHRWTIRLKCLACAPAAAGPGLFDEDEDEGYAGGLFDEDEDEDEDEEEDRDFDEDDEPLFQNDLPFDGAGCYEEGRSEAAPHSAPARLCAVRGRD